MPLSFLRKLKDGLRGRNPGDPASPAPGKSSRNPAEKSPPPAKKTPARNPKKPSPNRPSGSGSPKPPAARKAPASKNKKPAETPSPPPSGKPWDLENFVVPPQEGKPRFHDFDLPVEIMHAIADLDFRYCTPIQAKSLDLALAGRNVAGKAQTGTGKTAAFLIAILTRFLRDRAGRPEKAGRPRALIIAPTRELVAQIARDAADLGKYCELRTVAVFGGMDYQRQKRDIEAHGPVDLVVATPGRLLDYCQSRVLDLSGVNTLVIDEADRMLDMGFIPDVRKIVRRLPPKDKRCTMLYSATLSDAVMRLASQWMPDPAVVEIDPEKVAVDTVHQVVYMCRAREKFTVIWNLLTRYPERRTLIFCNRRVTTDRLADDLQRFGIPCELLSGDVAQQKRMRVLDAFRDGSVRVVVATDVAGRGLHVDDIGMVINYELPYEAQDYIHRIGRTGRAGNEGTAVSFACEDESFVIPEIEALLGEPMKCLHPEEALLRKPPRPSRSSSRRKSSPRSGKAGPPRPPRRGGPRRGPSRGRGSSRS